MSTAIDRWQFGDTKGVWEQCCSFLDLTVEEFMAVQERMWKEQMYLLGKSELGMKVLGGKVPQTLDEFKESVPLTTYDDYEPFLSARKEDVLPEKPHVWACTSGVGGRIKWIPITKRMYDVCIDTVFAVFALSTAKGRADFSLRYRDIVFYGVAPPPWASGVALWGFIERYGLRAIPSIEEVSATSDLALRAQKGFQLALRLGLDLMPAFPSVLVKIGEEFGQRGGGSKAILHPAVAYRILKGLIKSKAAGRPMLPRDIWKPKGLAVTGMDLRAFEKKILYYWGKHPYDFYINTEFSAPIAVQTWTLKGMTPTPQVGLLEFIPESERVKLEDDPTYKPQTVFLDGVTVGESYELAFTNFNGGIFIRYRAGDMITIVAPGDEEAGIKLPQLVFRGRADKLIDIAGFTRLDERTIWLALEDSGINYDGWMAKKETENEESILHIYLGTDMNIESSELGQRLHDSLKKFDASYKDIEDLLGMKPIRVTPLPLGTFSKYNMERLAQGADPGHFKEIHMQPPQEVINRIMQLGH